ncbi:MAG: hypothetical protein FVQ85_06215 [Planctomycetes bacterium]|nr:hypothetical protein [Planctomycetota bacterium]
MKFPEIPTDNLYKFMALSGIAIIIASFFPFYFQHKLHIQSLRLAGDKILLYSEHESLKNKTLRVLEKFDSTKQNVKYLQEISKLHKSKKTMTMKEFEKFSNELQKFEASKPELVIGETVEYIDDFWDKYQQLKALSIQIATKELELSYINNIIIKGVILFYFCALVGFILSCIGFSLWYKKLQVPLDMTIKNKIQDKQKQ